MTEQPYGLHNQQHSRQQRIEPVSYTHLLPSIRKHGAYMTQQTIEKALAEPDFLIRLAVNLKEERQKRLLVEQDVYKRQLV